MQRGGDPDGQLRPRHTQRCPRRRRVPAGSVPVAGMGQIGRCLQQERQHHGVGIEGRGVFAERALLLSGLREAVHLEKQLRQVHLVVCHERREQDVVLLRHVHREERGDLLSLRCCGVPIWRLGKTFGRQREAPVLGDHLGDRAAQLGACQGDAVDAVLLGQGVGEHLAAEIRDKLGDGRLVRATGVDDTLESSNSGVHVVLE